MPPLGRRLHRELLLVVEALRDALDCVVEIGQLVNDKILAGVTKFHGHDPYVALPHGSLGFAQKTNSRLV
jgi:hypothetical protein